MTQVVIDASALLALLNEEPGSESVSDVLSDGVMSSVNISEVATVLTRCGMPLEKAVHIVQNLIPNVIDFDLKQAFVAAELYQKTKAHGLSFGDRACLSLASLKGCSVVTSDKVWQQLKLDIEIELIR